MTGSKSPPTPFVHADTAGATDDAELRAFEVSAAADLQLPFDAHVVGEPVTVTKIRYAGVPRVGLLATCERAERAYEVSLADVVLQPGTARAGFLARYRTWLGFDAAAENDRPLEPARPHKVGSEDITVGIPVELIVLACKSNALRCRLLGTTREVTLRTAVRDEIPGSIITVTPKKQWTHARHPRSKLQWGRGIEAAETYPDASTCAAMPWCFNGAAASRPRRRNSTTGTGPGT